MERIIPDLIKKVFSKKEPSQENKYLPPEDFAYLKRYCQSWSQYEAALTSSALQVDKLNQGADNWDYHIAISHGYSKLHNILQENSTIPKVITAINDYSEKVEKEEEEAKRISPIMGGKVDYRSLSTLLDFRDSLNSYFTPDHPPLNVLFPLPPEPPQNI